MAEVGTDLLWFSKRALSYLKLSVPRELYDRDDGWRIGVVRDGVLEVGFVDGQRQELRVEQGSVLAANGEEILILPPRRDRDD